MIIKVIIILFALFVLFRTFLRLKQKDITLREFIIWTIFWSIIVVATFIPQETDKLAQFVGVERGADLFVYLSIILLYFIVFKIIVKLEKIDRNITKIVRNTAINNFEDKNE